MAKTTFRVDWQDKGETTVCLYHSWYQAWVTVRYLLDHYNLEAKIMEVA